jgi:FKBP-type peptidyl-prolyl cis-trans isomerase 2
MSNEESSSVVKKGDVIRIEYDAFIEESGELFDTTSEESAKDAGIFNEKYNYGPIALRVGGGTVFPGLDEAFEGVEIGVESEIVIPPEQAAGERDPKLVELHSMREFLRQEIQPQVGMEVSLGQRRGVVTAVTAGRVRVDFNNQLAGKELKYTFKVVEIVSEPDAKAMAVIEMDYGTSEGFEVEIGDVVVIKLPDVCKYDQKWMLSKYRIVADMREAFGVDTVQFIEEYAQPKVEETASGEDFTEEELVEEELAPEEIPPEEPDE